MTTRSYPDVKQKRTAMSICSASDSAGATCSIAALRIWTRPELAETVKRSAP